MTATAGSEAPPPRAAALLGTLLLAVGACATAPGGGPGEAGEEGVDALVPPGYGSLRQDEVTLALRAGDLQVKVTPLAESVTRLTAPDTYRRLHGIAETHGEVLARETGRPSPTLFLVSFYSLAPGTPYQPEDVELVSGGIRHRPLAVRPVTPGWGAQRLDQREAHVAVYAFGEAVDLDTDLAVEYRGARSDAWRRILTELQAERERVRARAGIGSAGGAGGAGR